MRSKIFLTSEVILDFLMGKEKVVQKIKYYSNEELCISTITLMELKIATNDPSLHAFLSFVDIYPFDEKSAEIAVDIAKTVKLNTNSIIEASICIRNEGLLYTKNREEYEGIKNLKLI